MASSSSGWKLGGDATSGDADSPKNVASEFDENVYLDFVRNAKRCLTTPAKKMPWKIIGTPESFP